MIIKTLLMSAIIIAPSFAITSLGTKVSSTSNDEYEPILDCPASAGAPNFKLLRSADEDYYLSVIISGKVTILELETTDGDIGYHNFSLVNPKKLGSLKKWFDSIYMNNNEDDVEDIDEVVITHGSIYVEDREDNQECVAVGKPKLLPNGFDF